MADTRCPICHSELTPEQTWTHDPICTLKGLAGNTYKKIQHIRKKDIEELQETREEQEIDVGIPEVERTTFTTVPEEGIFIPNKKHIRELRQSTEKILEALNGSLEDYFNYDEEGNYIGTYKYGEKIADKTEWTRVDRNISGYNGEPYMPEDMTHIYALDVEELRHPIFIGWFEDWTDTDPITEYNHVGSSYGYPSFIHFFQTDESYISTKKTLSTRININTVNMGSGGYGYGLANTSGSTNSKLIAQKPVIWSSAQTAHAHVSSLPLPGTVGVAQQAKTTANITPIDFNEPQPNIRITENRNGHIILDNLNYIFTPKYYYSYSLPVPPWQPTIKYFGDISIIITMNFTYKDQLGNIYTRPGLENYLTYIITPKVKYRKVISGYTPGAFPEDPIYALYQYTYDGSLPDYVVGYPSYWQQTEDFGEFPINPTPVYVNLREGDISFTLYDDLLQFFPDLEGKVIRFIDFDVIIETYAYSRVANTVGSITTEALLDVDLVKIGIW